MLLCVVALSGLPYAPAYAIDVHLTADQIQTALTQGKEAAQKHRPPDSFYVRFGVADAVQPKGFLITKTGALSVMATHMALRGLQPSEADVAQVLEGKTMLVKTIADVEMHETKRMTAYIAIRGGGHSVAGHSSCDNGIVIDLTETLRAEATPERAEREKAYLKSDLDFLGAMVPAIRRAAKTVHRQHHDLSHDDLLRLVEELWGRRIHELRMAAVELLDRAGAGAGDRPPAQPDRVRQHRPRTARNGAPLRGPLRSGHSPEERVHRERGPDRGSSVRGSSARRGARSRACSTG